VKVTRVRELGAPPAFLAPKLVAARRAPDLGSVQGVNAFQRVNSLGAHHAQHLRETDPFQGAAFMIEEARPGRWADRPANRTGHWQARFVLALPRPKLRAELTPRLRRR